MRIIGIDLGQTSLKAVEMDSAFGRYEINDYYEVPRAPGQTLKETLAILESKLSKKPDRIVVALPTSQVTFRNLLLPTKEKKAIASSVSFEIEDELPFSVDETVYDYTVTQQSRQASQVHVTSTLKKYLTAYLSTWTQAGTEPDVVTSEAWAYRAFLNRALAPSAPSSPTTPHSPPPRPVLLIRMGHARTTFYLHHAGNPVLAREIQWGGKDLTLAICQKYQIPLEQAEAAKLDHGFVVPQSQKDQASVDQIEFSDTITQALLPVIHAIRQIELSCKNMTKETLSLVYLSGGTSQLPGLSKVLEEQVLLSVKPIQALSSIAHSGVTYSESADAVYLLASALALSQIGADRSNQINLRKGSYSKPGTQKDFDLSALRKPMMALSLMGVCFFLSQMVQKQTLRARIEEADLQLEKGIRGFFGTVSSGAIKSFTSNTDQLKKSIQRDLTAQRQLADLFGSNPHSPLDFLKDLSQSIPKDVIVDLTQFQVGAATQAYSSQEKGSATLSLVLKEEATAQRLSQILGAKLTNLSPGKLEPISGADGKKKYKITFNGLPMESSYGK